MEKNFVEKMRQGMEFVKGERNMQILIVDDEETILEETKETVGMELPGMKIICTSSALEAMDIAGRHQIGIAFLDIEMPGMNGLELAEKLKRKNPAINIVFVTAYEKYALEAFGMFASGYLMKPLQREDVGKAVRNLRYPVESKRHKLRVQCFGNFEVFYGGEPVAFARAKAKEIFAYLVDLNGAVATTGELCGILWEDSIDLERNKHYLRNLISDVRKALRRCQADDVFLCRRNQFAVNPDKIECDYYQFLKGDAAAVNRYRGEYMKQYSWAELSQYQLAYQGGLY